MLSACSPCRGGRRINWLWWSVRNISWGGAKKGWALPCAAECGRSQGRFGRVARAGGVWGGGGWRVDARSVAQLGAQGWKRMVREGAWGGGVQCTGWRARLGAAAAASDI